LRKVQVNLKINFSTRSVGERIEKRGKKKYFYKPQEIAIKEIEEKEFVEERIKNAAEYHKKMIDEEKSGKRLEIEKK